MSIISWASVWPRISTAKLQSSAPDVLTKPWSYTTGPDCASKPRGCIPRSIPSSRGRPRRCPCSTVPGQNVTRVSTRFVRPAGMRSACGPDVVSRPWREPCRSRETRFLARVQLPLIKAEKRRPAREKWFPRMVNDQRVNPFNVARLAVWLPR